MTIDQLIYALQQFPKNTTPIFLVGQKILEIKSDRFNWDDNFNPVIQLSTKPEIKSDDHRN